MKDKIYIRDLHLRCIIGINDEERIKKQDILINIVIWTDLIKSGKTDKIEDSVNYKTLKKEIMTLVENSSFLLIEKLAEEIATKCLANKKINQVQVTVDKPHALRFARSVAVEITRSR
ncbi:MAG: dihydroneopterin aldolase [Spirochaetes bacterium]|nr:dihydroneopterin aldolase [Spirochaetota bacterium]